MQRQLPLTLALFLCSPAVAFAATIVVGNHLLLPNTPGQIVDIFVTGNDQVQGTNLNSQIADGGPLAGGSVLGPTYTASLTAPGAIFATNNTGTIDVTGGVAGHEIGWLQTSTSTGTVLDNGLYARLTFDTTGITVGMMWPLILGASGINGTTFFVGQTGQVPLTIIDGTVGWLDGPEPSSFVLGMFAAACLAALAVRKQRAHCAA